VREGKTVPYDLRPLVLELWLEGPAAPGPGAAPGGGPEAADGPETVTLGMRLRADPSGQGRPEEVTDALGLRPRRIHRLELGLEPGAGD
jgi:hypothetical protein